MTIHSGFILTTHLEQGSAGINIVCYVRGANQKYKLVFENQKHVFFIPTHSEFSPHEFQFDRKPVKLSAPNKQNVDAIYLADLSSIQKAKKYCEQKGIRTFEIDVSLTERFFMERFIFSQLEFQGASREQGELQVFHNPEIRPSKAKFDFSVLSLDIETGVGGELYSIAYSMRRGREVFENVLMLANEARQVHDKLTFYPTEKSLLMDFMQEISNLDPDFICGWHVIGFDLNFLENKCRSFGLKLKIGNEADEAKLDYRQGAGHFAQMKGRVVIDGPPTLRGAFYQFTNFKLETVAQEVLGIGKDIASDGGKVEEIERRFREDKIALAKYNLLDCTLVLDIFDKLQIVDLLKQRSLITGLAIDRLNVSTAAFDFIYLPLFHRRGFVASNRSEIEREEAASGGMVMTPKGGLHREVMVFDFKSLYPSIIRTFNICPLALIENDKNPIRTPEGFRFSQSESILPKILENLFEKRALAKENRNQALSQAIKILMNSFYGIMGSTRSRFYHADLPQAITTTGHYLLMSAKDFFENRGLEVIYGDTDSLFVKGSGDPNELTSDLDSYLSRLLKSEFQVESKLECEFEKKFDQLYFPMMRSGQGAAKKRYVGMISGEVEFKGMEAVRSDWTSFAREFQTKLYEKYFIGEDIEEFIRSEIKRLESGSYDNDLIYTKRLSKPAHEYTKNVPVHVRAALKVDHKGPYPLKEISYMMTRLGPEPVQNDPKDLDYDHYIEKQLKPIADDVLIAQNKNFDSLRLGDQLSLF